MKKFSALFMIVLSMIFTLVGCGQSNASESQVATAEDQEQSVSSENSSSEQPEEIKANGNITASSRKGNGGAIHVLLMMEEQGRCF